MKRWPSLCSPRPPRGLLALAAAGLLVWLPAHAVTLSFVKRVAAGTPGNFNYTYDYVCNNKSKGSLTVTAANDNTAKQLALMEAQEKCGEM